MSDQKHDHDDLDEEHEAGHQKESNTGQNADTNTDTDTKVSPDADAAEQSQEEDGGPMDSDEVEEEMTFDVVIEQETPDEDEEGDEPEDTLLGQVDESVLVPGGYPVLSLKHVEFSRKVKGQTELILDDVNIDFQLRRLYSVVTKSPARQAALMALMTGLRAPTEGSVLFRGTDLRQLEAADYRGHQIGAIFGTDALRNDLTAVENLVYTMDASGRTFLGPKDNLARRMLDRVGFPDRLQAKPAKELDGLNYRLASVARALCCECDVLIADEPTDGLEPGDWDTLLATLRKVSRRNDCAVILITSDSLDTADEGTYDDRFIVD